MIHQTVEEWRAEAIERFGSLGNAQFVCPACGNVTCVEDFRQFADQGATPDRAAKVCIGRYSREIADCDWAAFGLFGTLGKGRVVIADDGTEVHVFDFALPLYTRRMPQRLLSFLDIQRSGEPRRFSGYRTRTPEAVEEATKRAQEINHGGQG